MAKPMTDQWNNIQALYLTGLSVPKLAAQFNLKPATIRKAAERGHWRQLKENIVTQGADKPVKRAEMPPLELNLSLRQKLEQALEGIADCLRKPRSRSTVRELKACADLMSSLANSSALVQCWDQPNDTRAYPPHL